MSIRILNVDKICHNHENLQIILSEKVIKMLLFILNILKFYTIVPHKFVYLKKKVYRIIKLTFYNRLKFKFE